MAAATKVKEWTFDTAGDYTLATDATIAASVLSMTAPKLELPWATHWDNEPSYNGDGDAVLAQDVTYKAHTGGADIEAQDGVLGLRVLCPLGGMPQLRIFARYGTADGESVEAFFARSPLGGSLALKDAGTLKISDAVLLDASEWPGDVFMNFQWRFSGGLVTGVRADRWRVGIDDATRLASGTIRLRASTGDFTLGGGSGGTQDQPYLAYRRQGTCELKAAQAWTIPSGTTALGRLTLVADRLGGGTEPLDLTLQFKIDAGSWTNCPADGDLSGESFTAGTSTILWRLSTMDNANDCRYVPSVYAVDLTYQQSTSFVTRRTEPLVRRRG